MSDDLRKTLTAAICSFNVHVGIDGSLQPQISTKVCDEPCDYCVMATDHLIDKLKEGSHDKQPIAGLCGKAGKA